MGRQIPIERRFSTKYDVSEDGCWNWTGKINGSGYGVIAASTSNGVAAKELRAHRVSYEIFVGPIPVGLDLDHLCRNRKCVNPKHLEPVTRAENLRRGAGEHSRGKTHCKHGHEFSVENTNWTKAGYRNCRTCAMYHQRGYVRMRASTP